MEIKRSDLVRMVAEEVRAALREFNEAEEKKPEKDGPKKKDKGGKRPETKDASDAPSGRGPGRPPGSKNKDKEPGVPPPGDNAAGAEDPVAKGDGEEPPEDVGLPGDEEMADDNVDAEDDEQDALDGEGDADEEGTSGEINDAIQGLSVQSITIEPESLLLPGSKEVVLTFNEAPDVLRILVDQVGNVVFSWNGQLHDIP